MWGFSANEAQFLFTVDGCSETLGVLRFSGKEMLGKNYLFEIDVVCDSEMLDIMALQHQTACLTLQNSPQPRYIHGLVICAGHINTDSRYHHYRFHLVPQAELLQYRTDQRIFQNQSITDIIQTVWQQAGLNPDAIRFQTTQQHPPLTYCVQYSETDLNFIQRLCEFHGLFYYFEHSARQHTMVFTDGKENCPPTDPVSYQPDSGQNPDKPVLSQLDWQFAATAGFAEVREYDFTRPAFDLTGNKHTAPHEWYEYGTQHDSQAQAVSRATLFLNQQQHQRQRASATSNVRNVSPGYFLPVTDHPLATLNISWLVVSVQHTGEQPQVLQELANGSSHYQNQLELYHKDAPFFLPRRQAKPVLSGFQTALVTGPEGQEIYTDEHGRVKVQFHWDRPRAGDETTSCWLRVAQGWAGAGYGQHFLPRIGQEVMVAFAEHDIDRPYVIGCVHNAVNTPPAHYPAQHSQSGMRTLSSPGGSGFNELRFEDKKGKEQIVLHAQRNWYRKVKRTSRTEIGGNEHLWIGGEDTRRISGEEHLTINKNRLVNITGNQDLHVMQNKHLHIDRKWLSKTEQELHVKAGQMIILEASTAMSFDAGGSTLLINSAGIQMQGATVRVNTGGAASPALFPSLAKILLPAALSAIQLATFKKKAPFCEECEKCKGGSCAIPSASIQAKGSPSKTMSETSVDSTKPFTEEQKKKIQQAIVAQHELLINKREELTRWNKQDQAKFKKAFGDTSEESRSRILGRVNREIDFNNHMTLESFSPREPEGKANTYAYVHAGDPNTKIYLADKFWTHYKLKGESSAGGVLVHEESHMLKIGQTLDGFENDSYNHGKDIYYPNPSHKLARKRPDLAIQHADSFEYYIEDQ